MAAPGVPILSIETTDGFRLEVQVDAGRARFVGVGDTVAVALAGHGGGRHDERPSRRSRARNRSAVACFLVKVELPAAAAVRSGAFARARFTGEHRQALAVPSSAIQRRGQLVARVRRGRPRAVRACAPMTAGEASGDVVEVLAGMQPGETVIVNPPASLVDGSEVRAAGGRP